MNSKPFCRQCGLPVPEGVDECQACLRYYGQDPIIPAIGVEDPAEAAARSEDPLMRGLLKGACALWLIALVLPAWTEGGTEIWPGWGALLWGLIGGWAVSGWTVYANVFFGYVAVKLIEGARPTSSAAIMVLLLGTIPFVQGVPYDSGVSDIVSWGWGAITWAVAIVLMAAAAAVRAGTIARRGVNTLLGALVLGSALVVGLRFYQDSRLNEQEREVYLPASMAFTVVEPCGVPFVWPEKAVVAADSVVARDFDEDFARRVGLPTPITYLDDGYTWSRYEAKFSSLEVSSPPRAPDMTLIARRTKRGGEVVIRDESNGQTLYRQEFRVRRRENGVEIFCPMPTIGRKGSIHKGVDKALQRALGIDKRRQSTVISRPTEFATRECDPKVEARSDLKHKVTYVDGRPVHILFMHDEPLRGLCSESYVALYELRVSRGDGGAFGHGKVTLLDRATLQPRGVFTVPYTVGEPLAPSQIPLYEALVTGMKIDTEAVTIMTSVGNVVGRDVDRKPADPQG